MKTNIVMLAFASVLATTATDWALGADNANAQSETARNRDERAEGEIRRLDRDGGNITIAHGELKNLGVPAMTLVFAVADPRLLDGVKTGDKIRFRARIMQSAYTVTEIEAVK